MADDGWGQDAGRRARQGRTTRNSWPGLQALRTGSLPHLVLDSRPYWVTVVDAGLSSSGDVQAWCARRYPTLTAEQRAHACATRTLSPPHD